ncbi:hypothetical protein F5144DRAFT_589113 [Chaetomium tenue]|uniref:Uncharacterized protein n=1 Tax=Chaetomium tenue TaxID=1854479 RepID=A0ACB7PQQ0_9PEZI|nr:hypothetical protein F5144DRAFT_589113 [Chaetomium globosum]
MARKKRSRNIAAEFNTYFGAGTVQDWQRLCRDVGLTGNYTSITQCRKRFGNARQLAEYTMRTRKIFPKKRAKEMGPVRALLRILF